MSYPAAVFVDVTDLYHSLKTSKNAKVDYVVYMNWVRETFDLRYAKAYCNQTATPFQKMLQAVGFEVYTGKLNHAYEMVMDVLEVAKNTDTIVLGSSAPYIPSLARRLKAMGKRVIIFAANVPKEYSTLGQIFNVEDIVLQQESTPETKAEIEEVSTESPA